MHKANPVKLDLFQLLIFQIKFIVCNQKQLMVNEIMLYLISCTLYVFHFSLSINLHNLNTSPLYHLTPLHAKDIR